MKKTSIIIIALIFFLAADLMAQRKANMEGIEIGSMAPEIELPTAEGDIFKLSELKGKVVLINFWASWCKPCRKKAPELVEIYKEYKNDTFENGESGFEILSVSLDRNAKTWKSSIQKDSIGEFVNVGDMRGWKCSAAKTYNIKSIPSSVLLDGNGKIIALNLSPQQLEKKLKHLKKGGWFWFWFE